MGVAKRTARDHVPISALATLQGLYLARATGVEEGMCDAWATNARDYFRQEPLGTPAFRMRDLEAEFGPGATAYEVLAAAQLAGMR